MSKTKVLLKNTENYPFIGDMLDRLGSVGQPFTATSRQTGSRNSGMSIRQKPNWGQILWDFWYLCWDEPGVLQLQFGGFLMDFHQLFPPSLKQLYDHTLAKRVTVQRNG